MNTIDLAYALANRNSTFDIDCQAVKDQPNENLTEQSHVRDSDINNIVAKYEKTGYLDPFLTLGRDKPVYGDFTQFQDFQENLNTVITAQDAFDALPAFIRRRFQNDPYQLMQFLADPKNDEEAIANGLKTRPVVAAPTTPVTPATAPPQTPTSKTP